MPQHSHESEVQIDDSMPTELLRLLDVPGVSRRPAYSYAEECLAGARALAVGVEDRACR